jgi:hypothetical protein
LDKRPQAAPLDAAGGGPPFAPRDAFEIAQPDHEQRHGREGRIELQPARQRFDVADR